MIINLYDLSSFISRISIWIGLLLTLSLAFSIIALWTLCWWIILDPIGGGANTCLRCQLKWSSICFEL